MILKTNNLTIIVRIFKYFLVGIGISNTKDETLDLEDVNFRQNSYNPITCKFVDLRLKTYDGIEISCLMITPNFAHNTHQEKKNILYLHGNFETRSHFRLKLNKFMPFLVKNYTFFILDYREYHTSGGVFSKLGVNYDIIACVDYIYQISGGKKTNIIGYSLGAASALEYIRFINQNEDFKQNIEKTGKIILFGCFANLEMVIYDSLGIFAYLLDFFYLGAIKKICSEFDYNGKEGIRYLKNTNCLLIHSKNDNVISSKNALELDKTGHCLSIFVDGDHNSYFHDYDLIIYCFRFFMEYEVI